MRSFHSGMRLLMGQPEAMPLISVPVWQNGMPQSMQRALLAEFFFLHMEVKLVPILDALHGGPIYGQLAQIFNKAGRFSHWSWLSRSRSEKLSSADAGEVFGVFFEGGHEGLFSTEAGG